MTWEGCSVSITVHPAILELFGRFSDTQDEKPQCCYALPPYSALPVPLLLLPFRASHMCYLGYHLA